MLDPALGHFDYVVMMDSIIHYEAEDAIAALSQLTTRTRRAMLFTVAPRTPILGTMLSIGKLLPRGDRSPSIVPQNTAKLRRAISSRPAFAGFTPARAQRIKSGFYFSEAMEVTKC
jgi:magnesium-protoporphyrin O-methyltransferase